MGIIKPFKNKDGKILYPITRGEAVFVDDNKKLPTKLEEIETSIVDLNEGLSAEYESINIDNNRLTTAKDITGAINELFQSVSNGKTSVASAITDKGVTTSETETMTGIIDNLKNVKTSVAPINTENMTVSYSNINKSEMLCTVGKKSSGTIITGEGGTLNDNTGEYEITIKSNNGRSVGSDLFSEDIKTISFPDKLTTDCIIKDNGDDTYTYTKPGINIIGDEGKFIKKDNIKNSYFETYYVRLKDNLRDFSYVQVGNLFYLINGQVFKNSAWTDFEGYHIITFDETREYVNIEEVEISGIKNNYGYMSRQSPIYCRGCIYLIQPNSSSTTTTSVQKIDLTTKTLSTLTLNIPLYNFTTAFDENNGKVYFLLGNNTDGSINSEKLYYWYINGSSNSVIIKNPLTKIRNNGYTSQGVYHNGYIYLLDACGLTLDESDLRNDKYYRINCSNYISEEITINRDRRYSGSKAKLYKNKIYLWDGIRFTDNIGSVVASNKTIRIFDIETLSYEEEIELPRILTPLFFNDKIYLIEGSKGGNSSNSISAFNMLNKTITEYNSTYKLVTSPNSSTFVSTVINNFILFSVSGGDESKLYLFNTDNDSFVILSQPDSSYPIIKIYYDREYNIIIGITSNNEIFKGYVNYESLSIGWRKLVKKIDNTVTTKSSIIIYNGYTILNIPESNVNIIITPDEDVKTISNVSSQEKIFRMHKGRLLSYEYIETKNDYRYYYEFTYSKDLSTRTKGRFFKLKCDDITHYTLYNNFLFVRYKNIGENVFKYAKIDLEFGNEELIDVEYILNVKAYSSGDNIITMNTIKNIVYIFNNSESTNANHRLIKYVFPNIEEKIDCYSDGKHQKTIVMGDMLYLLGSSSFNSTIQKQIYQYDTITKSKTTLPNLPGKAYTGFEPIICNNKIYLFGGKDGDGATDEIVLIQYASSLSDRVKLLSTKMPITLSGYTCCSYNNKIYIMCGGRFENSSYITNDKLLIYDTENNSWTYGKEPPTVLHNGSKCFLYRDDIYVCSAHSQKGLTFYCYDIKNNSWSIPEIEVNFIWQSSAYDSFDSIKQLSPTKFLILNERYSVIIDMQEKIAYLADTGSSFNMYYGKDDFYFDVNNGYLYTFMINEDGNNNKRFKLPESEHFYSERHILPYYGLLPIKAVNSGGCILLFYDNSSRYTIYDNQNDLFYQYDYDSRLHDIKYIHSEKNTMLRYRDGILIAPFDSQILIFYNNSYYKITHAEINNLGSGYKKHLMNGDKGSTTNYYIIDLKNKRKILMNDVSTSSLSSITPINVPSELDESNGYFDSINYNGSLYFYSENKYLYKYDGNIITRLDIKCPEKIIDSCIYNDGILLYPYGNDYCDYYYLFNPENETIKKEYLNYFHKGTTFAVDKNKIYTFGNKVKGTRYLEYDNTSNPIIEYTNEKKQRLGFLYVYDKDNIYTINTDFNDTAFNSLYKYDNLLKSWKIVTPKFNNIADITSYRCLGMTYDINSDKISILLQESINNYDVYEIIINGNDYSIVSSNKIPNFKDGSSISGTWFNNKFYYFDDTKKMKIYDRMSGSITSKTISNLPTVNLTYFTKLLFYDDNTIIIYNNPNNEIGKIILNENSYTKITELHYDFRFTENYDPILLNNKIYFFGGSNFNLVFDNQVRVYDILNNKFIKGNSLDYYNYSYTGISTDGEYIYILGGQSRSGGNMSYINSFFKLKETKLSKIVEPINKTYNKDINLKSFNHKTIFEINEPNVKVECKVPVEI